MDYSNQNANQSKSKNRCYKSIEDITANPYEGIIVLKQQSLY